MLSEALDAGYNGRAKWDCGGGCGDCVLRDWEVTWEELEESLSEGSAPDEPGIGEEGGRGEKAPGRR